MDVKSLFIAIYIAQLLTLPLASNALGTAQSRLFLIPRAAMRLRCDGAGLLSRKRTK